MAHLADQLHIDKQIIDRVESAVLLSLIGGGLMVCVLGAISMSAFGGKADIDAVR